MGAKEYLLYLDEAQENRCRYAHVWERGEITEFCVQYKALIHSRWRAVVRFDSAHGSPHRDVLLPDEEEIKSFYPGYANAEVLTIGRRDIMENWRRYRKAYEMEMQ